MPNTDIRSTTVGNSTLQNFSVSAKQTDGPQVNGNTWDSPYWTKWYGYYIKIPELKQAIDSLAMWTVGKGYKVQEGDKDLKIILERITGWGEDSFLSIMENLIRTKKINGDAFAEIIEKDGTLVNLKPLNPSNIRIVVNEKGIIERYEQLDAIHRNVKHKFEPSKILHLCNGRIADETHGLSVIECCEEIILARNEIMADWRKALHRNIYPLKIVELDTDDTSKINTFITNWEKTVKDRETIFIPKGTAGVNVPTVPMQSPESYIRYLENFFYQSVGVPKIILGGSQEFTEASSKIGYLTFEQVYMSEQMELESDLWNQLGIKVTFNRPVSLKDEIQTSEAANTGQTGFQPNETDVGVTRTE